MQTKTKKSPYFYATKIFRKIYIFLEMIKYQHSLHVLPFVYLGAVLAKKSFPGWNKLGWITLGMVCARATAMALNRYIDREIDARNPRTAIRAIPSGMMTANECLICCGITTILGIWAALHLPSVIWLLTPFILGLFIFYPFTKRFTWTCHLWLGFSLGLAPLGGWLAVTGEISMAAVFLLLAVFCLIVGSDIIYTMQDYDVDRSQGLFSIPARFGLDQAVRLAKWGHNLCFIFLVLAGISLNLNNLFYAGVLLAAFFTFRHNRKITAIAANQAFALINAFVSLVILAFTLASLWINTNSLSNVKLLI
ncbi:MAG: UbiA family prenyltransferase [Candidatus Schekmanbacteria bacterium]|nr:UbiA family prenyltransferase [Candidatus Schekmanbacteria bacterium]